MVSVAVSCLDINALIHSEQGHAFSHLSPDTHFPFSLVSHLFEQKPWSQASYPEWQKQSTSLPPAVALSYNTTSGLFEDETLNGKRRWGEDRSTGTSRCIETD